ncbi:NAD(P)-dependent oxidoreductase [Cnuibacter sp. UC19_7]|uniref:NAD(P)-dependent oxidoreductase n=1 Tax=Cnuibacter sp. UC19_7 TaxID=3350166 RepID=UPI003671E398
MDRVGFLGLGIMGAPMALNLVRAGVALTVWNRSEDSLRTLEAEGARRARDVSDLFERSDVVIVMLANSEAVDAVLDRAAGGIAALVPGRTIVTMSTLPPEYSRRLAAEVRAAGGEYVEAPVSGSRRPAEEGALVGMTAGDPDAVERVAPLLQHLCASVTYCGEIPSALSMKLAVNVFLISVVTGLAESFHFAESHGLDTGLLRRILDAGQMASPISAIKTRKLVERDWEAQASIRDVLMNNTLITTAAREAGIPSPLLDVCERLYTDAVVRGDGALDMAAVIRAIGGSDLA